MSLESGEKARLLRKVRFNKSDKLLFYWSLVMHFCNLLKARKNRQSELLAQLDPLEVAQLNKMINDAKTSKLARQPARLPGRQAFLYFGIMLSIFTFAYK